MVKDGNKNTKRTLLDLNGAKIRECVAKCVPTKVDGYTMGTQIKGFLHKKWGQKQILKDYGEIYITSGV